MAITLGILFGIIAMLSWGIADFFAAKAVRKTSVFKVYFWIQAVNLAALMVIFLLFFRFPALSFSTVILILITGLIGVVSILAFYKGLQVGTVSIVSPIAASYAVVTVLLSLIFLNETLTSLQAIAVSMVILGAVLTSFKFHDLIKLRLKKFAKGVKYAVIAMLAWGVLFVLLDILVSQLGWFLPVFLIVIIEVVYLLAYSGTMKKSISFPKNIVLFVILVGILEAIAFLSFGYGITFEHTAILAPIISAFPAVTIILARIFFREILDINQKLGIVSILAGLVLLSI
jgi:drug/metabolite transporter (DMT)-like permease